MRLTTRLELSWGSNFKSMTTTAVHNVMPSQNGFTPKTIHGKKTKPPVGLSLLPILKGQQREAHKEIYWRFNKANAVRQGDLKAIRAGKSWELYDLNADPTETNNIAAKHPDKTKELAEMWEQWNAKSVGKR